ncbi:hypothetical protein AGIG_G23553 [Arapaima gigas]
MGGERSSAAVHVSCSHFLDGERGAQETRLIRTPDPLEPGATLPTRFKGRKLLQLQHLLSSAQREEARGREPEGCFVCLCPCRRGKAPRCSSSTLRSSEDCAAQQNSPGCEAPTRLL